MRRTIATPPGATIRELMEDRGLDAERLAALAGLPEEGMAALLDGSAPLGPEAAARLQAALGPPAAFWSKLETTYRRKLAETEKEDGK